MKKSLIFLVVGSSILFVFFKFLPLHNTEEVSMDDTEENFYLYKEDREAIIRMLINGEIKKEPDRGGNEGFFFYYTPSKYIDAVKSDTIRVGMHSKDRFFVFFQSAEQPSWDMNGLQEGFIYSSTGEFPTAKEFDYYSDYKKIDDHWYFVSDDSERFKNACKHLCN